MRLTLIGHCTFLIETGGKKIVTDPYLGSQGNLVYKRLAPPSKTREELKEVDLVLLSHTHWDHVDRRYLHLLSDGTPVIVPNRVRWLVKLYGAKNVVGVKAWEHRTFGEITVTAVPASHVSVAAVGFVIQSEGKQIYFAGDTYYHNFMEKIGQQFHLDVALLSVTTYRIPMTMGEREALHAVKILSPKVVIPIHLGVEPRLPWLRTNHSPEGFQRRVQEAELGTRVIILREGQDWEV
jgi:L-ascorbate metabolism protein UlaG (beta-lactamase superfamily)